MSDSLSLDLTREVCSPERAEADLSVWQEAVITSVQWVSVVGWASVHHIGIVPVQSKHSIAEFSHVKSTVTSGIVTGDEEIKLIAGWENTDGGKSVSKIVDGDGTTVVTVEDLEGISEVEVGLKSACGLLALEFILTSDHVAETLDKLILVSEWENWLAGWGGVPWEALSNWGSYWRGGSKAASSFRVGSASSGWSKWGAGAVASASAGSGGNTCGSSGLLEHLSWAWVGRSEELSELRVGKTGISVGVHSADDGKKLGLSGVVTTASEEGAEVEGIDAAIVVPVDRSVGRESGEVVSDLKISLQDVESSLEINLLLDDLAETSLDIVWEGVEAANSEGWSVQGDVSEEVVSAWQKHLQETIRIKGKINALIARDYFLFGLKVDIRLKFRILE